MINELARQIHENAKSKGFYERERNFSETLMLIVSELSEAQEADRKNHYAKKETFLQRVVEVESNESLRKHLNIDNPYSHYFEVFIKNSIEDELADALIRILDLSESIGMDMEWHIKHKMKYNSTRPHKHGKKY